MKKIKLPGPKSPESKVCGFPDIRVLFELTAASVFATRYLGIRPGFSLKPNKRGERIMKTLLSVACLFLMGACCVRATDAPQVYESQTPAINAPRKVAIFVNNNAGTSLNDKVPVLESAVASQLASSDFSIISRDDVLEALKVFPVGLAAQQPLQGTSAEDQNLVADRNTLGTRADRLLSDNSSALRLAQNMGADFLLIVTMNSLATNETQFADENVQFTTVQYVLRANYKVLEGVTGGAIGGDDFEISKEFKMTLSYHRNDGNMVNELLREAAEKVADSFMRKASAFRAPAPAGRVEIEIACGVRDLDGNEMSLPDIRVNENNEVIIGGQARPVMASATVEIDGIALGTTPAKIKIFPGLHKLRLTREGCNDYEATINAAEGLNLAPTLQLSNEGFQRWKEIRAFLNGLDTQRKLTDAQLEVMQGYAQYLRQSRYSVNIDEKVDTKEGIKFNLYKSLY